MRKAEKKKKNLKKASWFLARLDDPWRPGQPGVPITSHNVAHVNLHFLTDLETRTIVTKNKHQSFGNLWAGVGYRIMCIELHLHSSFCVCWHYPGTPVKLWIRPPWCCHVVFTARFSYFASIRVASCLRDAAQQGQALCAVHELQC